LALGLAGGLELALELELLSLIELISFAQKVLSVLFSVPIAFEELVCLYAGT
jgi:hypothetical protein